MEAHACKILKILDLIKCNYTIQTDSNNNRYSVILASPAPPLKTGVYHHDTAESGSKDFSSGYFDGFMKGCTNSGRSEDNCNVQTDASTP